MEIAGGTHLMEDKVPDGSEDFVMILKISITPLPESWNNLYVFSSRIDSFWWRRRIYLVEMGDELSFIILTKSWKRLTNANSWAKIVSRKANYRLSMLNWLYYQQI